MAIAKAELERLRELDRKVQSDSIITFDGLELILKANEFDPERIGRHFLDSYYRQKAREIRQVIFKKT